MGPLILSGLMVLAPIFLFAMDEYHTFKLKELELKIKLAKLNEPKHK